MPIHLITEKATPQQLSEMMVDLGSYVKLAVDVDRKILAGGGKLHADCEAKLLEIGCNQENVWGADWFPFPQRVAFESLINIRSRQGNYSMEIENDNLRMSVEKVAKKLLAGVKYE